MQSIYKIGIPINKLPLYEVYDLCRIYGGYLDYPTMQVVIMEVSLNEWY